MASVAVTSEGALDLDAYLDRIGWRGETKPTHATLAALLDAHMTRVPFENLDVLLGRPVRVDLGGVQAKLVKGRRGGYCFEHATLFAAVLERIGFAPLRHSARVTVIAPRSTAPRTHMFLTVSTSEGRFVIDPGFGVLAPRFPVPLVDRGAGADGETAWMARDGAWWTLRVRTPETIVDAWASTLEEDHPIDFEMANHYTSTHPASAFVNRLMMRAITPEGRVTVSNRDVTWTNANGARTETLADRAALRRLLVERFGFDLPEVDAIKIPSLPEWS